MTVSEGSVVFSLVIALMWVAGWANLQREPYNRTRRRSYLAWGLAYIIGVIPWLLLETTSHEPQALVLLAMIGFPVCLVAMVIAGFVFIRARKRIRPW